MAERPIIFNGEMVRAILDSRKTQTRRVIRPQPKRLNENNFGFPVGQHSKAINIKDDLWGYQTKRWRPNKNSAFRQVTSKPFMCPYGKVGDLLWVKETRWRNGGYVATDTPNINHEGKKSARFMKKIDARIWLEITNIRVERVQDITKEDSKAEGVIIRNIGETYWRAFRELWDPINAKSGFGYDKNPWVWVITFKKVD